MHALRLDRAIGQFRKRLVSIIEVKDGRVEHLNSAKHDAFFTAVTESETNRFQGCPVARSTYFILFMRQPIHTVYLFVR